MHIATLRIFMSDPGGIINSVPLGTQPQRVRKPMDGRRKAGINGISVTLQAETIAQLGIVHPDFIVQRIVLSDSVGPIQIITAAEKQLMFFPDRDTDIDPVIEHMNTILQMILIPNGIPAILPRNRNDMYDKRRLCPKCLNNPT